MKVAPSRAVLPSVLQTLPPFLTPVVPANPFQMKKGCDWGNVYLSFSLSPRFICEFVSFSGNGKMAVLLELIQFFTAP